MSGTKTFPSTSQNGSNCDDAADEDDQPLDMHDSNYPPLDSGRDSETADTGCDRSKSPPIDAAKPDVADNANTKGQANLTTGPVVDGSYKENSAFRNSKGQILGIDSQTKSSEKSFRNDATKVKGYYI
jgi:hypothetical protein